MTALTPTLVPPGYREDPRGNLVREANIHPRELLADQLVRDLVGRVQTAAADLSALKRDLLGDVAAFVALVVADYGAQVSGADGGVSLTTYDGRLKVERVRADRIQVGPEILAAEQLVREILSEITDPIAKPIAERAFSRHKKTGELSAAKLIALAGVEIDDPRWREAQRAIKDSLTATGTVTYFRAYRRSTSDQTWEQIPLDFSAIEPAAPRPLPAPPANPGVDTGGVQ
jgi:hypothetical protein